MLFKKIILGFFTLLFSTSSTFAMEMGLEDDFQAVAERIDKSAKHTILILEANYSSESDSILEMLSLVSNKDTINKNLYEKEEIEKLTLLLNENQEDLYQKAKPLFDNSGDLISLMNKSSMLIKKTSATAASKIKQLIYEKCNTPPKRLQLLGESFKKLEISNTEDEMFIAVFPEAFFNYFSHPDNIGNFIPFLNTDFKDFFKQISQEHSNVLFIPNIIYIGEEVPKNVFGENFKIFGQHSYTQSKIIGLYDKYKNEELIKPIFNETFVFLNGEILKSYKKQYILDQDMPIFPSEGGSSYVIWDERCLYVPGMQNQVKSKTLSIEICQDHYGLPIKETPDSRIMVIQSATINLRPDLKDNYSGLCIHADIIKGISSCLKIDKTKEENIAPTLEKNNIDMFEIKSYPVTGFIKKL